MIWGEITYKCYEDLCTQKRTVEKGYKYISLFFLSEVTDNYQNTMSERV